MKKYIYSIILLAISSVILSSCGTLSITKRVHNKGYHVSYTKHYSSDSKELETAEVSETPVLETAKIESTKTGSSIRTENAISKTQTPTNQTIQNESVSTDNTVSKTGLTKKKSVADFTSSFKPEKVIFGNNENQTTIQKMAPDREGGMSMLWIVILIILILWLLGYLGGLGSFIHLLLVIALILLILWLLHII